MIKRFKKKYFSKNKKIFIQSNTETNHIFTMRYIMYMFNADAPTSTHFYHELYYVRFNWRAPASTHFYHALYYVYV